MDDFSADSELCCSIIWVGALQCGVLIHSLTLKDEILAEGDYSHELCILMEGRARLVCLASGEMSSAHSLDSLASQSYYDVSAVQMMYVHTCDM